MTNSPVALRLPTAKDVAVWFDRYTSAGLDPIHWELSTRSLTSRKGYKGPVDTGWVTATYTAPPAHLVGVWQCGLRLGTKNDVPGSPANGRYLCVVDIEDRNSQIVELAVSILPPTSLVGGKGPVGGGGVTSGCSSHRFYWTEAPMNTFSWRGPTTGETTSHKNVRTGKSAGIVLELLGCGRDGQVARQVVVAPSIHLESGLQYGWSEFGEAGVVSCADLYNACKTLATRVEGVELAIGKNLPPTGTLERGATSELRREAKETLGLGAHKVSPAVAAAREMPDHEAANIIDDAVARISGLAEGERNSGLNLLCFVAASLLSGGGRPDGDFLRLRDEALAACEELPGVQEMRSWSDTIERAIRDGRAKPRVRAGLRKYALTAQGLADLLADEWRDHYRYVWEWRSWIRWNGKIWEQVPCQEHILRSMVTILRWAQVEAARDESDTFRDEAIKFYYRCESGDNGSRASALLRDELDGGKGLGMSVKDLDKDPYLFTVQNGTYDMQAGGLRDFNREDFITRIAPFPYVKGARCDKFLKHIEWTMSGKVDTPDMVEYLSRWLGYGMTGLSGEQAILIMVGEGANGKSCLVDVCLSVMGSGYAIQAARELVLKIKNDTKNKDEILDLEGRRLAVVSEPDPGQHLSEGVVKALTGSKTINVKGMYAKPRPIDVVTTIIMDTNNIPRVSGMDYAIYRRLKIITFDNRVSEDMRINNYWEIIVAEEGTGVLTWLLEQAHRYVRAGMPAEPASLRGALADFRASADTISAFLTDRCEICRYDEDRKLHKNLRVSAKILYEAYSNITRAGGSFPCSMRAFANAVRKHGEGIIETKRVSSGIVYVGIGLREMGDPIKELDDIEAKGGEAETYEG